MDSRSFWLRRERNILWGIIAVETFLAAEVVVLRLFAWYGRYLSRHGLDPVFQGNSFLEGILTDAGSDHIMLPTMFLFYPIAYTILFAVLVLFLIRGSKNPVTGWWSTGGLFFGSILPMSIWFVYSGFVSGHRPIETVVERWACIGIPLAHVLLFYDLHRYTKAIRAQETKEGLLPKLCGVRLQEERNSLKRTVWFEAFFAVCAFFAVMEWWICLSIPLTHFFLFRDLHRYTKAIRVQSERDK